MLKRAQEEGIVRTTIAAPSGIYTDLEASLRETFDLPEVIIAECSEDRSSEIMARIGEAAAHFLETSLQPGEIIGVSSWSETILRMVENLHPKSSGKAKLVIQTLGGMGDPSVQAHATQLTTRLAKLTGGEPRLLNAPGVAQSREAKLVLVGDPFVRETMDLFGKVTMSIVGIGSVEPSSMLSRSGNVFSGAELDEVSEAGGVGDICLRFFDREGKLVKTPLDSRVIGMSMDELIGINQVVALAGGESKTNAIQGALKTGAIDVLITDKFTAHRLLDSDSANRMLIDSQP